MLQLTTAVPNDSFSLNLGGALSQECSGGMEVAAAAAAPVAPTQAAAAIAAGTGHGNRRKGGGVGGGKEAAAEQILNDTMPARHGFSKPPPAGLMTASC